MSPGEGTLRKKVRRLVVLGEENVAPGLKCRGEDDVEEEEKEQVLRAWYAKELGFMVGDNNGRILKVFEKRARII
jgi:hypothetical protein